MIQAEVKILRKENKDINNNNISESTKTKMKLMEKEIKILRKRDKHQEKIIGHLEDIIRHERSLWDTRNGSESGVAGHATNMHHAELFDEIINNDTKIHNTTFMNVEKFKYTLTRITLCIKQDNESLLFRDNDNRSSDPGNRCKLSIRQALLMILMYKKGTVAQGYLASLFGVDQSAISRYIKVMDPMLSIALPTANNISKEISDAKTKEEFKKK